MSVITGDTLMDTHVARSQCFQLVFSGNVLRYGEVSRVLWSSVRQRLSNLTDTEREESNASVVVVFNEEYILPSEYVSPITPSTLTLISLT